MWVMTGIAFMSCGSVPETAPVEETSTVEKDTAEESHETLTITDPQAYVAVMDFEVLTTEEGMAGLSQEIPQEITGAFLRGQAVQPVERAEFEKLIDELKLSMSYSEEEAMLQAGKTLGADFLMFGSFSKIGDQCKINFRLVDTETSEILFSDSVRGMFEDIFDLEEEVAQIVEDHIIR